LESPAHSEVAHQDHLVHSAVAPVSDPLDHPVDHPVHSEVVLHPTHLQFPSEENIPNIKP